MYTLKIRRGKNGKNISHEMNNWFLCTISFFNLLKEEEVEAREL